MNQDGRFHLVLASVFFRQKSASAERHSCYSTISFSVGTKTYFFHRGSHSTTPSSSPGLMFLTIHRSGLPLPSSGVGRASMNLPSWMVVIWISSGALLESRRG